jgi:serine/threonine protein kinase/beta-lactam-binding protein with PASTA domain
MKAAAVSEKPNATVVNDRYEITKRIGRGGMADVFLARDQLLDRQVAVKMLFPEFAVDPNFVERFRREAQAAASLNHPNIVAVFDWGRHGGTYFITMEYVQGRTLAEILRANRQLTSKQAADIGSEVAAALAFAHDSGLAHRDIKPANILIGSNGQVKVTDFGIARAMNSATESQLTQAGAVMGTASYFSPEQAQGAQPDPRSDLYSLGIVMYEMVAGQPPFTGDNPVSIAYKQVHDTPTPLHQIVVDIPRAYEAIVNKLLAKKPAARYQNAEALREDLRRFRSGEPVAALTEATAASSAVPTATSSAPVAPVSRATDLPTSAALVTNSPDGNTTVMPATSVISIGDADDPLRRPGGPSAPDTGFYQEPAPRTGWYAIAAFIALFAIIIGGIFLFQALSSQDEGGFGITLEDYTNQPLEGVTGALTALKLTYRSVPEPNALVNENFVHRTSPAAGTLVFEGDLITIYFNPLATLIPIPTVRGLALADAERILASNGFSTSVSTEQSELPEGTVVRTIPSEGELVRQDTAIEIIVSAGREQVRIPRSVLGDPVEDARELLESDAFGLIVQEEYRNDPTVPAGVVITTDPVPNQLVDRGSVIILIVSSGPEQVIVPDLIGMTETQAIAALRSAGLRGTSRFVEIPFDDPNDGRVIDQTPEADRLADRDSEVEFVVGRAPLPTTTTTTPAPPTTASD